MRKKKINKRIEAMVVDSQTEMYVMHFAIAESIVVYAFQTCFFEMRTIYLPKVNFTNVYEL